MTPPATRLRRLAATVAAAAMLLGGAACGGSAGSEATPTTRAGTSDGLALAQIERLLISRVPPGFVVAPEATTDTGPTDLATAVRHQGGTAEIRTFFEENGFNGGYQRLWVDPANHELLVFLYQYSSSEGAKAQSRQIEESIRANEDAATLRTFFPDTPGSIGLLAPQRNVWIAAVLFAKGDYWAMIRLAGPDGDAVRTQAAELAQAQWDRLP